VHGGSAYAEAHAAACGVAAEADRAPSARVLAALRSDFDGSYVRFMRARSAQTRRELLELPFAAELAARFVRTAEESMAKQQRIECADAEPFETFRQAYLSADRLGLQPTTRTQRGVAPS
jgi:glutamate--cysteine ligase